MKNFLRKYGVRLSLQIIVMAAFGILSVFIYPYIFAVPFCFIVLFLPTLIWCIHAWEKEQRQNNPDSCKRKGFWFKYRSLFLFHGIIIGTFFILVGLKSIYPHHESLDLSVSILFLLPVALYSFAGIYLAGALMGIHLVQQKRMSFLDILFSTGIWYLLTIFSFGILILGSAYLHKLNNILKLLTWYPILGSTCALFLAEIITTVTLKSRK